MEASMIAKVQACMSAMLNYSGPMLYDQDTIAQAFGPIAAMFAAEDRRMYHVHAKYPAFFCGPLAEHIKCIGNPGHLIKNGLMQPALAQFEQKTCKYYADLFAADTSSVVTREVLLDAQSLRANNLVRGALDRVHCPRVTLTPQQWGTRAFVPREVFIERAKSVFFRTGDSALDSIWNAAGVSEAGKTCADSCTNYCFAGGFISKLLDPFAGQIDNATCDADIFVYGSIEEQTRTIDTLVRKLYEPGTTYSTIRGGLYNIRRIGRMDVQIVSSPYSTPQLIIAGFDAASTMSCWTAGTVIANAKFVQAFANRVSSLSRTKPLRDLRPIKVAINGFTLRLNKTAARRGEIMALINDAARLTKIIVSLSARLLITPAMPEHTRLAHIMAEDNVQEVITDVSGSAASRMLLSHVMDAGYTRAGIEIVELNKFDTSRVNRTPDTISQVIVAGFPARFQFTYANIRANVNAALNDIELVPESITKLVAVIETLRGVLAAAGLTLNAQHVIDDHGIIRAIRIAKAQRSFIKNVMLSVSLKCIDDHTFELVVQEA